MYNDLFRNRWALLAVVILTLVGVSVIFGSEGDHAKRPSAEVVAARLAARSRAENPPPATAQPAPQVVESAPETSFADDDELIDKAEGYDPTPEEELAGPAEPQVAPDGDADTSSSGDDADSPGSGE